MNPLTQIKNTQKATRAEIDLGIGDKSSWHARFKHSAYVYAGGLPYELTEGDILAVFSQYGEIVDVHLVRDKTSGKSKGFAFLAFEDQRSTVLAVDNLSGARVAGRTIRVEHVENYRKKRAEVEGEPVPSSSDEDDGGEAQREAEAAARRTGAQVEAAVPATAAGAGPSADEPWAGGGSVFGMLTAARQQQGGSRPWLAGADGGKAAHEPAEKSHHKKERKAKKEKKEKKERKEKKRGRSEEPVQRRGAEAGGIDIGPAAAGQRRSRSPQQRQPRRPDEGGAARHERRRSRSRERIRRRSRSYSPRRR